MLSSSKSSLFNEHNQAYLQAGLEALSVLKDVEGLCIGLNRELPTVGNLKEILTSLNQSNNTKELLNTACMAINSAIFFLAKKVGQKEEERNSKEFYRNINRALCYCSTHEDFDVLRDRFKELLAIPAPSYKFTNRVFME